jgi:probable selenium-dependent hydroxylase accessory protein YqeC
MIIALVGAGGKPSLGNQIGTGLSGMGRRVLFTTTTKINRPENHPLFLGAAQEVLPLGFFMTAAKSVLENGKLEGYSPAEIGVIANSGLFDDIIV